MEQTSTNDGASVTLLTAANEGDTEFQIFDSFNVAAAINSSGDQTCGSLHTNGWF